LELTLQSLPRGGESNPLEVFARDVLQGLSRHPKVIPPRYFYDDEGSRLFQQITGLKEYYPTRCELEILQTYRCELAELFGDEPVELVELGPGDGTKTELLLRAFFDRGVTFEYVPIDISEAAIRELGAGFDRRFDRTPLTVRGIVAEYFDALRFLKSRQTNRYLVLFLGSNIGNLDRCEARQFLHDLRTALSPGDSLLIGIDLKKDVDVLTRAYNDSAGVTRACNFNLLRRINRELGADFDLDAFEHYGPYNVLRGRMESWLVSRRRQEVHVERLGRSFHFEAWEGIHVENSYKYDLTEIELLAESAHFEVVRHYTDRQGYFVDSLWRAAEPSSDPPLTQP